MLQYAVFSKNFDPNYAAVLMCKQMNYASFLTYRQGVVHKMGQPKPNAPGWDKMKCPNWLHFPFLVYGIQGSDYPDFVHWKQIITL